MCCFPLCRGQCYVRPENTSVVLMQSPNPPEEIKALSCGLMLLKLELGDLRNDISGQSELVAAEHSPRYL